MLGRLSRVILVVLALVTACGGPSPQQKTIDSPMAAAEATFEVWAQVAGIPYRNERYSVTSNDGTFATVWITAELRETVAVPWTEGRVSLKCKKIGERWQCDISDPDPFHLTARAEATAMAMHQATSVAVSLMRATATAEHRATVGAHNAQTVAAAIARLTSVPQATATALAATIQELERLWGPASKCHGGEIVIGCDGVVVSPGSLRPFLYEEAYMSQRRVTVVDPGMRVRILEGTTTYSDPWWKVGTPDGLEGWGLGVYFEPAPE